MERRIFHLRADALGNTNARLTACTGQEYAEFFPTDAPDQIPFRVTFCKAKAISFNARSPTPWPKLSLIALK